MIYKLEQSTYDVSPSIEINTEYGYEGKDLIYLLQLGCRLSESEVQRHIYIPEEAANPESIRTVLLEDKEKNVDYPNRELLIPYNPGHFLWVGLYLKIEAGNLSRAECISSFGSASNMTLLPKLNEALKLEYPGKIFTMKAIFLQANNNRKNCGPLTVENLLQCVDLGLFSSKEFPLELDLQEIKFLRAHHIRLFETDDTEFYERPRDHLNTEGNELQINEDFSDVRSEKQTQMPISQQDFIFLQPFQQKKKVLDGLKQEGILHPTNSNMCSRRLPLNKMRGQPYIGFRHETTSLFTEMINEKNDGEPLSNPYGKNVFQEGSSERRKFPIDFSSLSNEQDHFKSQSTQQNSQLEESTTQPLRKVYYYSRPIDGGGFLWALKTEARHAGFIIDDPEKGLVKIELLYQEGWNDLSYEEIDEFYRQTNSNKGRWCFEIGETYLSIKEIIEHSNRWMEKHPKYNPFGDNCCAFTDAMLKKIVLSHGNCIKWSF